MINREEIDIYENEKRHIQWVKGEGFTGTDKSIVLLMHDAESIFLSPKDDMFGNVGWEMHNIVKQMGWTDYLIFGYENAGIMRFTEYSIGGISKTNKYGKMIFELTGKSQHTPGAKRYISEGVFKNLIPHMEKKLNFNFKDTKKVMIGSSMGGQITTYTAVTHPGIFDAFISMSTCLHYNSDSEHYIFSRKIQDRYYHDMGGRELSGGENDIPDYLKTYYKINDWLNDQKNQDWMTVLDNTATHSQGAWKERMPVALAWAIRKGNI